MNPDVASASTDAHGLERNRTASRLAGPVREFLHLESAGGVVLLVATVASLVVANSPAGGAVHDFWATPVTVFAAGSFELTETLEHWVNSGLMAIFFFAVALEIKRELVDGQLQNRQTAALPAIAALGGVIVPALVYFSLNAGGGGADGWGIPQATDIAFAVGVMALLGSRVSPSLKVFLLTLAIVDDIIAILVIAIFYSDGISPGWLLIAFGLLGMVLGMRLLGVWYVPAYVVVGAFVWLAFLESGVHATIAGVVLGLMTPAKALSPQRVPVTVDPTSSWGTVRETLFEVKETLPVAERLQHIVHPWTAFIVLPVFAFVNAGIPISVPLLKEAASSPVTLGIILGLVIGKPVGIVAATWIAVRTGVGVLPTQATWRSIVGVGALAGIGFTVSLFVAGLAFDDAALVDNAKVGVLTGSVLAAVLGAGLLARDKPAYTLPDRDTATTPTNTPIEGPLNRPGLDDCSVTIPGVVQALREGRLGVSLTWERSPSAAQRRDLA